MSRRTIPWTTERVWHVETALARERALSKATPSRKELKHIYTCSLPGVIANDYAIENAVKIEASFDYNGTRHAFNGARMWPAVRLSVQFPSNAISARDAFVEKLKAFVSQELSAIHNR